MNIPGPRIAASPFSSDGEPLIPAQIWYQVKHRLEAVIKGFV
jgi:hypothetical protein